MTTAELRILAECNNGSNLSALHVTNTHRCANCSHSCLWAANACVFYCVVVCICMWLC